MDEELRSKLDEANKLIFVKQYSEAERILDQLIRAPIRHSNLLAHLRAAELAAKSGKLDTLRRFYLTDQSGSSAPELYNICLAFIDQNTEGANMVQCLQKFQDVVTRFGPSAAGFYGIGFCLEAQGNYDRAAFNYEQSIATDPSWYPSYFGLSQIAYHVNDEKKGDNYFYQYEQAVPYNVYGNFETHRRLSKEFELAGRFIEAEAAVQTLSDWWRDNKGYCPPEIQVFELLCRSKISEAQGDAHAAEHSRQRARSIGYQMLQATGGHENILYFTARQFDEYGDRETALKFYKHILRVAGNNPQVVQRIGGQFLVAGEFELARELFEEAYDVHPDNTEIRFCRLVTQLKLAKVPVEDYLIGKERLRQLVQNQGDRVEILALLHSLLAKFPGDPEVHYRMGEIYLRLANAERAAKHFRKMFELDPKSRRCRLKLATFLMQQGDPDEAMDHLKAAGVADQAGSALDREEQSELGWLKSTYYLRKGEYQQSLDEVRTVLKTDPWNISYVVQEVVNLTHLLMPRHPELKIDETVALLSTGQESALPWDEFDSLTDKCEELLLFELGYARRKLRVLYAHSDEPRMDALVRAGSRNDPTRAQHEFMKLLNTNFDSPFIAYGLGMLSKELWQLEIATMWFDYVIGWSNCPKALLAKVYLEYADALAWHGHDALRAVEYAKLAMDLGDHGPRVQVVLAHAHLKNGDVRNAQSIIEVADDGNDPEAKYLKGLIQYRNGAAIKANQIWKPLLTHRSQTNKDHHMKQEILKFYFEGTPYLTAN